MYDESRGRKLRENERRMSRTFGIQAAPLVYEIFDISRRPSEISDGEQYPLEESSCSALIDSVPENMSVTRGCNVRGLKCGFGELSLNAGVSLANGGFAS